MKADVKLGEFMKPLLSVWVLLVASVGTALAQPAQQQKSAATTTYSDQQAAPQMPQAAGTTIDRLVAIVNGDLILDSDVDEEQRFEAIQPFPSPAGTAVRSLRIRAIERLINRDLILQQAKLQPENAVSDSDIAKQIDNLRKNLPECKEYRCETDPGWATFLAKHGFTPDVLQERWRQRMQVLSFIEDRFRLGIKIQQSDISNYYQQTFLPQFTKQHATAPKLETVSNRIQEVLLQQQVSSLLNDWLRSLRAQGSVVVLHPGEEAP